ncbi:signal recognition particle protein [endosymbiont of Acanthamoeba sp. UWC8]|uniref:signal recognition particle protein n=1 Tax=endosymbiont of Acanthamoeba sp. UWC8 TaxID=86106 RepID=UPI0004D1B3F1|nr:signal recognition particle protein [endosymbiont of Acanthamoeba sp. UWC8]AIF81626.1 signal recognition particle protein [endosymbiont of Acanthamoeba sp. UWC8]
MFSSLSNNLTKVFDKLKRKGLLNESDVSEAMREIRIALLEADVALPAVKEFIDKVKAKAIGSEIVKSISPAQMVIKIVNDELTEILGSDHQALNLAATPPVVIMLVGLQGSGKTTSAAKLALLLRKKHKKKVLLASLDVYRPAAQAQLEVLGKQIDITTLPIVANEMPEKISKRALEEAKTNGFDILILDTAGRLHTDQELIEELNKVKILASPVETILVVDSLTGQDAVNIGKEFNTKIGITGVILTRVDGDARGGAALSMRCITKQPIKFIGVGEKLSDLEEFHPQRAASKILGMGDIVSLVERAAEMVSEEEAKTLAKRVQKGQFDLNDMLAQFKNLKKMGGIGSMLSMIPGLGKLKNQIGSMAIDDKMFTKQEAIINSMSKAERSDPKIINASRKVRIANGSGTKVQDINRLLKQHLEMSNMVKKVGKMDHKQLAKLGKMMNV